MLISKTSGALRIPTALVALMVVRLGIEFLCFLAWSCLSAAPFAEIGTTWQSSDGGYVRLTYEKADSELLIHTMPMMPGRFYPRKTSAAAHRRLFLVLVVAVVLVADPPSAPLWGMTSTEQAMAARCSRHHRSEHYVLHLLGDSLQQAYPVFGSDTKNM